MKREEISAAWIVNLIKEFTLHSPHNSLRNQAGDKAWDAPLVGFSAGDDPLYDEFKHHIGTFHWTPAEIFSLTFPDAGASGAELTVISWIFQTARTKKENRLEQRFPSERWIRSRYYGEQFNAELRKHVLAALQAAGCQALAPEFSSLKKGETSPRYGRASTWSERHAAFASGLGTFGLCDGLITAVGKAMRCGSVIARIKLPPTARPYRENHHAYCLYYAKGTCGKCIERCPVDAISLAKGHDKETCRTHSQETARNYVKSTFGIETYGCGLCQTGVPCESRIPLNLE